MKLLNFLAITLSNVAILGHAAPAVDNLERSVCTKPPVRKEWRTLTTEEKSGYINAVLCLTTKKAISGISGTVNRYDDFHAVHNNQTPNIHWVGHFILWHRYFVASYEKALINECGWTGGQPYWDWSLDVSEDETSTAVFNSVVFDPKTGFGGNGPYLDADPSINVFNLTGRTGGGCVLDGPFTNSSFMVNYPGPPKCLTRDSIPWIMNSFAQQDLVDLVLAQPDYTAFSKQIENVPNFNFPNIHGSGHFGVGGVLGTIGDAYNSPGDPLFYLHHGNLDRILTQWQYANLTQRLNQVGGPVVPFDYSGVNVTLDFTINLGKLAPNITLKQALNTQGSTFCYTYDREDCW
ncbi:Di-copper centre-containing protein [Acephala macrosclerotiorum]|nr:Di-copper centre-containing protein [Acephala macrosclerotiorum]